MVSGTPAAWHVSRQLEDADSCVVVAKLYKIDCKSTVVGALPPR